MYNYKSVTVEMMLFKISRTWYTDGTPDICAGAADGRRPRRGSFQKGSIAIMIKAGIIGSTGYAGGELVRLLKQRDDVRIVWYGSKSYVGQPYAGIYQNMYEIADDICRDDDMAELAEAADVIFTATPQGLCASLVSEEILSKAKIIDLSADFRIKDVAVYEEWYKLKHAAPQFIGEAVYGLPEINRDQIAGARLVANPGCYPTCSTLSVWPLAKEGLIDTDTLIIDAKSGVSGAGLGRDHLFCEVRLRFRSFGTVQIYAAVVDIHHVARHADDPLYVINGLVAFVAAAACGTDVLRRLLVFDAASAAGIAEHEDRDIPPFGLAEGIA